jgi:hypothetical protein
VIVLEWEGDARRVMEVLPKRLNKYGLTLHPEKTRLLKFSRPRPNGRKDDDDEGHFQRIPRRYPLPRPRVRRRDVQLKLSKPLG